MMVIDMTAQLAPVINGTLALLVVAAVAVFGGPVIRWVAWVARQLRSVRRDEHQVPADTPFRMAA